MGIEVYCGIECRDKGSIEGFSVKQRFVSVCILYPNPSTDRL